MPLISKGIKNKNLNHKLEGISDDFVPDLLDKNLIDDIILINDEDAINMSTLLAKKLGLGVGITSGANFLGAVISNIDNVITIFPDDLKKYLSIENVKQDNFISNQVELIDFKVI